MVNRHRGEIEALLDGKSYRLCLTLGALAELEHAFGEDDMLAVAERFEAGRIAARDAIRMLGAGLRGAGYDIGDEAVATMRADGGAAGFVDIVAGCWRPPSLRRGAGRGATLSANGRRRTARSAPSRFPGPTQWKRVSAVCGCRRLCSGR